MTTRSIDRLTRLTALLVGMGIVFTSQAQPDNMSAGEYVARLGNCVACHTTADGAPFAGGVAMEAPNLGIIYGTNITPDIETGIGGYSFEDFDRAVRLGITPDGRHLYPAMPYPSYALTTEADMRALYDYFMNEVEPVRQANPVNVIPEWKSARWPMAIWNMLFVDDKAYRQDPNQSESWNRGAYLVQGLGHCGACHTPRGILFQEKALDSSNAAYLAGAPLDHWSASSLRGDTLWGLGRWSEEDIVALLKTGRNDWGPTFGTMVEVVNNSTQYMTDTDLAAVATFLKSLSPVAGAAGNSSWVHDSRDTAALLSGDFSSHPGAQVYFENCMNCHGYDGLGHPPYLPPLAGNTSVLDPDPSSIINLTLNSSLRLVIGEQPTLYDMPFYRHSLEDEEIAAALSFVRSAWGNNASAVDADAVAAIRAATDPVNADVLILRMK